MENDTINISSIVSAKTQLPYVQLKWGKEGCQMSPEEARAHAYAILDAANAAETDAIMVRFMSDRVGLEAEQYGQVLQDFRLYREKNKGVKEGHHRVK